MSTSGDFGNPLRKFKLVFLGEQSGEILLIFLNNLICIFIQILLSDSEVEEKMEKTLCNVHTHPKSIPKRNEILNVESFK